MGRELTSREGCGEIGPSLRRSNQSKALFTRYPFGRDRWGLVQSGTSQETREGVVVENLKTVE